MAAPIVNVSESEATVSQKLCKLVIERANAAIKDRGVFVVGVSGKDCMCQCVLSKQYIAFPYRIQSYSYFVCYAASSSMWPQSTG